MTTKSRPRFLVTAGNTREKIDAVRDWGNIFTGRTGLDIALALTALGDVQLLTSNLAHAMEHAGHAGTGGTLRTQSFGRHQELLALLETWMAQPMDAVFMSAAVSDYEPVGAVQIVAREPIPGTAQERWIVQDVHAPKIKSTHGQIAIVGRPTLKLIDQFRGPWKFQGLLVKFKLEVGISEEQLRAIARESRIASGADLIVANTLAMVHGGEPGAYILGDALEERVTRAELPGRLCRHVQEYLAARKPA